MKLEDAQEIVWQREFARMRERGIVEVSPSWRQAYLGCVQGRLETLGVLYEDILRSCWLCRLVDRLNAWTPRGKA